MHRLRILTSSLVLLASASAAEEAAWRVVTKGKLVVKVRERAGTSLHEVWAEGDIAAPVARVQDALVEAANFKRFMPHVKESRYLSDATPEGTRIVYVLVRPPMIEPRDYVVEQKLESDARKSPDGVAVIRWKALTSRLPKRSNIVRITTNEGFWHITPLSNGKSHAVYRFLVDPGGMIPAPVADLGNRAGISDTFEAVEKEANRLAASTRP
jgi:hypothetical protein